MAIDLQRYKPPGPIGAAYLASLGPISIIMGPAGSGKTVASVMKGPLMAATYWPVCRDGWVRIKYACIRDTYRDFARTFLETWYEIFPEAHPWTVSHEGGQDRPVRHRLQWQAKRGGEDIKIDFLMETGAIGDMNIDKFAKGYEVSMVHLNECDMLDERVPGMMWMRTGRYPPVQDISPSELDRVSKDGARAFKLMDLTPDPGEVILPRILTGDLNPPDADNWVPRFCEQTSEERKPGFVFFRQPSGLSQKAENRAGKPRSSYEAEAAIMTKNDARRFVHGQYGYALDGRPVYEDDYDEERHLADQVLDPLPNVPLSIGLDAGGTPAVAIAQFLPNDQCRLVAELCCEPGAGATTIGNKLLALLMTEFAGFAVREAYADPSSFDGADRQSDELSYMQTVEKIIGVRILPAPSNEVGLRHDAVRFYLNKMIDGRTPVMIVSPRCKRISAGFAAHYKITKKGSAGETDNLPIVKNKYSHPHDALQYLCLGHVGKEVLIQSIVDASKPKNVVGILSRQRKVTKALTAAERARFNVFDV